MAPSGVDKDFLKKMMKVIRKKNRTQGINSPESRCAGLERLLRREVKNPAFEETVNTALTEFTKRGRHHEAQVLLVSGADPNYRESPDGYTLLHVAVDSRHAKMVEVLMKSGALSSKKSADKKTPLVMACMNEDQECARILLEHGADPNEGFFTEGRSLLMGLVEERKSFDLLELLLEKGADPNFHFHFGWSLEEVLYFLIHFSLRNYVEEMDEWCRYAVRAVPLMLRYGFRPRCCGNTGSLLKMSLFNFTRFFSLAALLLERDEPFEQEHICWIRLEVLREALRLFVLGCSEAEARPLLDKANALLDRAIVRPPMVRFTLTPKVECVNRWRVWTVGTVLASLKALCRAAVRRSLLPCPLKPKIQALLLPDSLKDELMPLNVD